MIVHTLITKFGKQGNGKFYRFATVVFISNELVLFNEHCYIIMNSYVHTGTIYLKGDRILSYGV